jgi:hypothetical protein
LQVTPTTSAYNNVENLFTVCTPTRIDPCQTSFLKYQDFKICCTGDEIDRFFSKDAHGKGRSDVTLVDWPQLQHLRRVNYWHKSVDWLGFAIFIGTNILDFGFLGKTNTRKYVVEKREEELCYKRSKMMRQTILLVALLPLCTAQEAACVTTLADGSVLSLQQGDSYGDALESPCGDIADYPCFCDANETDKIRCPYCSFVTGANELVCARSGENITFIDEFNIQQTCSCVYLGNNQVQTSCEPQSVPTQQCALERNTDRCDELTQYMSFDVNCPCVSFCLGEFIGCCNYGESCSVNCPGGATEDDIVAGCKIDPFKVPATRPPVAPVAPVAPTLSPALAPRECMLQANTQNCPTLTKNQAPVEGCSATACYNYCDDQFFGCCELDDMDCSVQCSGSTQPVITAGCTLDQAEEEAADTSDVCGVVGQSCSQASDCCSARCVMGTCARPGIFGQLRAKLRANQGDAAAVSRSSGGMYDGFRQLESSQTNIRGSGLKEQEP